MKTEIKVHSFTKLLRISNAGELSLWIISVIIYINKKFLTEGQKSTSSQNVFILFHILHVFCSVLCIFLICSFPRSFQVINILQSNTDSKLEKTLFNDLIIKNIFFNVSCYLYCCYIN